jgi:transposase
MLNENYSAELLNLEDAIITKVKNTEDAVHIFLELPRRKHSCPCCGTATDRIHDYREQLVRDTPLGRDTYLHLRKRRYRCLVCGKRFFEKNDFLPRYYRVTNRLVAAVLNEFRGLSSATRIAKRYNISVNTALRYFDQISYGQTALPRVVSIDEFKGNTNGEKYQTIVTDPENHKVLDILPNRFEGDLIRYFRQFPERNQVKYFVTDMNPHFKAVAKACFPQAKIIADRYHVTRQVIWAMEKVRKAEQNRLSKEFRRYFKRSRGLLNKSISKLSEEEMDRLTIMFQISPKLSTAYRLKNKFLEIMHTNSSEAARPMLADWLYEVENLGLDEFNGCVTAYRNWATEILNSLDVPWSNGFTEGCNNKIKVLKRVSFGVQRFDRFRNRILHCAS